MAVIKHSTALLCVNGQDPLCFLFPFFLCVFYLLTAPPPKPWLPYDLPGPCWASLLRSKRIPHPLGLSPGCSEDSFTQSLTITCHGPPVCQRLPGVQR